MKKTLYIHFLLLRWCDKFRKIEPQCKPFSPAWLRNASPKQFKHQPTENWKKKTQISPRPCLSMNRSSSDVFWICFITTVENRYLFNECRCDWYRNCSLELNKQVTTLCPIAHWKGNSWAEKFAVSWLNNSIHRHWETIFLVNWTIDLNDIE